MHIEFKPSSDFNNVKINRAPDGLSPARNF